MTPKEKAKELVKMFQFKTEINKIIPNFNTYKAIECALIAVDVLIEQCDDSREYWNEVKHEIEKL
jgi:hypothetical protein